MKYPQLKWKTLTPAQLQALECWLIERAGEMRPDRASVAEEEGFDLVGAIRSLARRVGREADRRRRG